MTGPRNKVLCKDCGLSIWDAVGDKVFMGCSCGYADERLISVSTARRLLITRCPAPLPAQRHGHGPGCADVFDVAVGRLPKNTEDPKGACG